MTTHCCLLEMWWEFARRNRHIATTTNAIERLHEEFQAADRDADGSAIGRHRRLHHIRRHPAKSLNRERTPSAPQVLSLAWAFITRLKGTLFLVVLFGDESLGDRLGDPACVRPRQENAGRIAVGKPPVVSACSSTIRPRDCQPPSLKSLWKNALKTFLLIMGSRVRVPPRSPMIIKHFLILFRSWASVGRPVG